ncbi:MAG: mannose-1-phosphate guanylyltransferase [Candidatus Omnitrophica bacterium]|nr:mannose-1-phosphate guanylyltransferase [Candidatus Omnitrophota bacterium]
MLWALVMAGGLGTRLWPLSRKKRPKPFLDLIPGRANLLQETIKRLNPLIPANRIWVIGNEEHLSNLRRYSPRVPKNQIIGEPASRNTAPTVAFGAAQILRKDPRATVLVLPADHWIGDKKKFHKAVCEGLRVSERTRAFSIFGVKPAFPSSSYGYLKAGKEVSRQVYQLRQFVEKPSPKRAKAFLKTGRFFWHAGIFLALAQTMIAAIQECAPRIAIGLSKLNTRNGKIVPAKVFHALPSISVDYAVLEKLDRAYLIRGDFDWCDVGTWKAFEALWPKDKFRNSVAGSCFALNSQGNLVYSKNRFICLQGVNDLVVIDTPDALLVSRKDSSEEMRRVVLHLAKEKKALSKYS